MLQLGDPGTAGPPRVPSFDAVDGDPARLMREGAEMLLAISCAGVFMGANTYLGNAPNFMVRAICEEQEIRMPGVFGYMLWSGTVLLPVFGLVTLAFFGG